MPSNPASPDSTGRSPEEDSEDETVAETIECPSCGQRFASDYCPKCGQKSEPAASTSGIFEDFARELFDIEQGFLETLRALTFSPGQVLQTYLEGGRRQIMSPGRYLVAALVIQYVAIQGLKWTGALAPVTRAALGESSGLIPRDASVALQETAATFLRQAESQEGRIVLYLLAVGILAALLSRLFRDRLRRRFDTVALSGFLIGHAVLLETAVHVAWVPPTRLLAGGPVSPVSPATFTFFFAAAFVVFLGYVGWATYQCFGPGWRPAAKGLLGAIWTQLELGALVGIAGGAYVLWLARGFGEMALVDEVVLGLWGLCAAPLLLHMGCEAYCRLR
jgi:hypothetical protein